jgi:hypothetical protein
MAYKARPWGSARSSSAGSWPTPASTQATFARLSAEELREDPGDRFVALVSRHLRRCCTIAGWWRPG